MKNVLYALSFFFILTSLNFHIATAQNPSLVADVNTTSLIPAPDFYGRLNTGAGLLLFNATDNHGFGLWRSDGTTEGTYFLTTATTIAGENMSVEFNGEVFFSGYDGNLWKTDGTSEGTILVKTFSPVYIGSYYGSPVVNGFLYFSAAAEGGKLALWKTDGTTGGTTKVSDIEPSYLTLFENQIVFAGNSSLTGYELYITDGTESGTVLLKDIYPGVNGSNPRNLIILDGAIYFFANEAVSGSTLWKTDGTSGGTEEVKIFAPNQPYGGLTMAVVNDKLLIYAFKDGKGNELWVSDGTTNGTELLYDIYPGINSSNYGYPPPDFFVINNVAYFPATVSPNNTEFWRSDGTIGGTFSVKNILGDAPLNFTALPGGKFVFTIYSYSNDQLWVSDGTSSGTHSINKQFYDNQGFLSPVSFNGDVFFVARGSGSPTTQLCFTDGTSTGTNTFPINTNENNSSSPAPMIKLEENKYVFVANDGVHGRELFATNGISGASLLQDIISGSSSSLYTFCPFSINGTAYFASADTIISNIYQDYKLWKTDGTSQGTVAVKACNPRFDIKSASLNGEIYFINQAESDFGFFTELWKSDGTPEGTHLIKDINPSGNDQVSFLVMFNNAIYFAADDGVHGGELWKTDGSIGGTVMVKDINPGSGGSAPNNLTVFNGKIFFGIYGSPNYGLWSSDGTAEGTVFLNFSIPVLNLPTVFVASGNYLYYPGNTSAYGDELWKTDGTIDGTELVKDIKEGPQSSTIRSLTDVNGLLFFIVISSQGVTQLWKSDGTELGTVKVISFLPDFIEASDLTNVNGVLYLVLENYTLGTKVMWQTDGAICHTQPLDFNPDGDDQANILLADSNIIFLGLKSEPSGVELWRYEAIPIANVETCNGLDDDCNGIIDDNVITATISPSGIVTECKGVKVNLTAGNTGADLSYQWLKNGESIAGATNQSYSTNKSEAGSFSVQVTNTSGCSEVSDGTEIIRLDKPDAIITPPGSLDICESGFVDLQANNGAGYTYHWALNGDRIIGATNQVYHATEPGKYKVAVKNNDGCSGLSAATIVITSCKLSQNSIDDGELELYPNPVADILNVRYETLNSGILKITNLLGESLICQPVSSPEMQIDVTSLIPGAYLLKIETEKHISSNMFIKE